MNEHWEDKTLRYIEALYRVCAVLSPVAIVCSIAVFWDIIDMPSMYTGASLALLAVGAGKRIREYAKGEG